MANIWITYAWADNKDGDIDFIAQELEQAGVNVQLDRWNLKAGERLWNQLDGFISNPEVCDAWLLIASENSLASEACKEEYAYALDRTLRSRGDAFPVIALFRSPTDDSLIPAGIRTRLHVSITDPDWKERIVASAEGRDLKVSRVRVEPYVLSVHEDRGEPRSIWIEVRPRAGVWAPFVAAIPMAEKESVNPHLRKGAAGRPNALYGVMVGGEGEGEIQGEAWWAMTSDDATPTQSFYIQCAELPSRLMFGANGGAPQFQVNLRS